MVDHSGVVIVCIEDCVFDANVRNNGLAFKVVVIEVVLGFLYKKILPPWHSSSKIFLL